MSKANVSPLVAPLAGAAFLVLAAGAAQAASCCGGGGSSTLILPKYNSEMVGFALDVERSEGLWHPDGRWVADPPGSDLNQYRVNAGYARRFDDNWQGSVNVSYVWNSNTYGGLSRRSDGLGDTSLALWYEAFDNVTCVYQVRDWEDLAPAIYLGAGLTVPTGVSPYDDVRDNFDITGRGFYRLDANLLVEKTIYPWSVGLQWSYGTYAARPVNSEYGNDVAPYTKRLGDRTTGSVSVGYTWTTERITSWTATLAYSDLREDPATVSGERDRTTGFEKRALAATIAWSSADRAWTIKGTWSHTPREDDWGKNFPTTDVITLGLNHVLH